jgi:tRNA(fMet)-specific endonuclease VapC
MPQYLLDTDHLTLYDHRHAALFPRVAAQPAGAVALSPVSAQEYLKGRLAALARHQSGPLQVQAYANLVATLQLLRQFPIVDFDAACEAQSQRLRALRLRVGSQDLRIAAVALTHGLVLLTRNRRDFAPIPGLQLDDWSV